MAWAISVEEGAGSRSGATSDQRPAPAGGPRRVSRPGWGRARLERFDARRGTRSGPNVSLVISPAHTRSQSAVSRTASSAVPAAAEISGQNDAPARANCSRIASCNGPSGGSGSTTEAASSLTRSRKKRRTASVVGSERARTRPDELAGRAQLVEHRGAVALDARGQHVALQHRHRDGDALELLDRLDEACRCHGGPGRSRARRPGSERT